MFLDFWSARALRRELHESSMNSLPDKFSKRTTQSGLPVQFLAVLRHRVIFLSARLVILQNDVADVFELAITHIAATSLICWLAELSTPQLGRRFYLVGLTSRERATTMLVVPLALGVRFDFESWLPSVANPRGTAVAHVAGAAA